MESSVQKTRKVLEYLLHKFYYGANGYPHARLNLRDNGMIKAALSIPLRNCDVGTAEEQAERFSRFCQSEVLDVCSKLCPLYNHSRSRDDCAIQWEQMPYSEGGAE